MLYNDLIGRKVTFTEPAIENYGEEWRGKVFTITAWYDHYVPSSQSNWQADKHGSPGFDSETGSLLHGLDGFSGDVYGYEIRFV